MQTLLAFTGESLCDVSHFSEKWSKYQVDDDNYAVSCLSYVLFCRQCDNKES